MLIAAHLSTPLVCCPSQHTTHTAHTPARPSSPSLHCLHSCLQLLVAVVNLVVANTPFSAGEVQQLQAQHPGAIDAAGRFNTLKALCFVAKIDYAHVKVGASRGGLLGQGWWWWCLSAMYASPFVACQGGGKEGRAETGRVEGRMTKTPSAWTVLVGGACRSPCAMGYMRGCTLSCDSNLVCGLPWRRP
jgi:hypothetical protein